MNFLSLAPLSRAGWLGLWWEASHLITPIHPPLTPSSLKEEERSIRQSSSEELDLSERTARDRETKLAEEVKRLQLCCVELESQKERAKRDVASVQFKLDTYAPPALSPCSPFCLCCSL